MESRSVRPASGTREGGRWTGALLPGAAVLYLLALGALRDRFPAVPNLLWVKVLAALLIAAGAVASGAVSLDPGRVARHQRLGRGALLVGAAALVLGLLSVREAAEAWTSGARAAGALALCASLALLPFAVALRRRLAPVARVHAAAEAERRAWLAAAYPQGAAPADADAPPPSAGL